MEREISNCSGGTIGLLEFEGFLNVTFELVLAIEQAFVVVCDVVRSTGSYTYIIKFGLGSIIIPS